MTPIPLGTLVVAALLLMGEAAISIPYNDVINVWTHTKGLPQWMEQQQNPQTLKIPD